MSTTAEIMRPLSFLLIVTLAIGCPTMLGGLFQPSTAHCHSSQDGDTEPDSSPLATCCLDGPHSGALLGDPIQRETVDAVVAGVLHDRTRGLTVVKPVWSSAAGAPRSTSVAVFLFNSSLLI